MKTKELINKLNDIDGVSAQEIKTYKEPFIHVCSSKYDYSGWFVKIYPSALTWDDMVDFDSDYVDEISSHKLFYIFKLIEELLDTPGYARIDQDLFVFKLPADGKKIMYLNYDDLNGWRTNSKPFLYSQESVENLEDRGSDWQHIVKSLKCPATKEELEKAEDAVL